MRTYPNYFYFMAVVSIFLSVTQAFQPMRQQSPLFVKQHHGRRTKTTSLFESNKEDEIAKLEEQLKKLKEEKEAEAEAAAEAAVATEEPPEETPIDMFMTESWKEKEAAEEGESGNLLGGILPAIGILLALILFSQVPIGQEDLSKYSVGSSPTANQIDLGDLNRARNAGDL